MISFIHKIVSSSKIIDDMRTKGKIRANSIKRKEKNSSFEPISILMEKHFGEFLKNKPRLTRKQQVYIKYFDLVKKENLNELTKRTMFKWCSNIKNSSRNHDYRSLETPREKKIVINTLRSLKKVSVR